MNGPPSDDAREMARVLLGAAAAGAAAAGAGDAGATAGALRDAVARMFENLRHSVGDDGLRALLARVTAPTSAGHPMFSELRQPGDTSIRFPEIDAAIERHGAEAVVATLETLFAALIDVLGSLIGVDMAMNLLSDDRSSPSSPAVGDGQ